jgi:Ca2+-binding EF-hand superfamily protein
MASKYKAEFDLPKEFPSILKAFTREILRYQPDNIYEFGATYFQDLLKAQAAADNGTTRRLAPDELETLLRQLFLDHDRDGNGFLDHREFRALLNSANLGLSSKEVKRILAEADENEDGTIEYAEFIPLAIDLVQAMYMKIDSAADKEESSSAARAAAESHMLHGMPREALESIMGEIFKKADLDGSGTLSRREFNACLKEADLGLTRQEINLIMAEADVDDDGVSRCAARAVGPDRTVGGCAGRGSAAARRAVALRPSPSGRDGSLARCTLR